MQVEIGNRTSFQLFLFLAASDQDGDGLGFEKAVERYRMHDLKVLHRRILPANADSECKHI